MLIWLSVDVSSWYSPSQHFLFHSLTESCLVSDLNLFLFKKQNTRERSLRSDPISMESSLRCSHLSSRDSLSLSLSLNCIKAVILFDSLKKVFLPPVQGLTLRDVKRCVKSRFLYFNLTANWNLVCDRRKAKFLTFSVRFVASKGYFTPITRLNSIPWQSFRFPLCGTSRMIRTLITKLVLICIRKAL